KYIGAKDKFKLALLVEWTVRNNTGNLGNISNNYYFKCNDTIEYKHDSGKFDNTDIPIYLTGLGEVMDIIKQVKYQNVKSNINSCFSELLYKRAIPGDLSALAKDEALQKYAMSLNNGKSKIVRKEIEVAVPDEDINKVPNFNVQ